MDPTNPIITHLHIWRHQEAPPGENQEPFDLENLLFIVQFKQLINFMSLSLLKKNLIKQEDFEEASNDHSSEAISILVIAGYMLDNNLPGWKSVLGEADKLREAAEHNLIVVETFASNCLPFQEQELTREHAYQLRNNTAILCDACICLLVSLMCKANTWPSIDHTKYWHYSYSFNKAKNCAKILIAEFSKLTDQVAGLMDNEDTPVPINDFGCLDDPVPTDPSCGSSPFHDKKSDEVGTSLASHADKLGIKINNVRLDLQQWVKTTLGENPNLAQNTYTLENIRRNDIFGLQLNQ
ncbi:hypothetical protein H4219_004230 [Mycoemilia scoparia]|uniref:Uncharacterized protein n=1 Tax=Mycoemilia scoparia TaxID=417184 RepID=A0A9W7ZWU0_9FUNG|nr:hypothetical protein H4219_004230 [Mycoemilia scoparia]